VKAVNPEQRWLATLWPFVGAHLPPPPARVLEIGCGRWGGVVPQLRKAGYEAVGVDPDAPDGAEFRQMEFERYAVPQPVNAVVASLSLHHVSDLGMVLDQVTAALRAGGTVVVAEWAQERFDEATAQWCFARLARPATDGDLSWLGRRRDEWLTSGQPWDAYRHAWMAREGMHTGQEILAELDKRFQCDLSMFGPYFFVDLPDTTEFDELAAIRAGTIQASGIRYIGRLR
jgi:SAM-dependent methyltransferase